MITEKEYKKIEKELCRRVKLPYPPKNRQKYEVNAADWTQAEENDFRLWLTKYLRTLNEFKGFKLKYIKKTVDWYLLQYSWKYKEDTNPPISA